MGYLYSSIKAWVISLTDCLILLSVWIQDSYFHICVDTLLNVCVCERERRCVFYMMIMVLKVLRFKSSMQVNQINW